LFKNSKINKYQFSDIMNESDKKLESGSSNIVESFKILCQTLKKNKLEAKNEFESITEKKIKDIMERDTSKYKNEYIICLLKVSGIIDSDTTISDNITLNIGSTNILEHDIDATCFFVGTALKNNVPINKIIINIQDNNLLAQIVCAMIHLNSNIKELTFECHCEDISIFLEHLKPSQSLQKITFKSMTDDFMRDHRTSIKNFVETCIQHMKNLKTLCFVNCDFERYLEFLIENAKIEELKLIEMTVDSKDMKRLYNSLKKNYHIIKYVCTGLKHIEYGNVKSNNSWDSIIDLKACLEEEKEIQKIIFYKRLIMQLISMKTIWKVETWPEILLNFLLAREYDDQSFLYANYLPFDMFKLILQKSTLI
jgi:hypothetical protein